MRRALRATCVVQSRLMRHSPLRHSNVCLVVLSSGRLRCSSGSGALVACSSVRVEVHRSELGWRLSGQHPRNSATAAPRRQWQQQHRKRHPDDDPAPRPLRNAQAGTRITNHHQACAGRPCIPGPGVMLYPRVSSTCGLHCTHTTTACKPHRHIPRAVLLLKLISALHVMGMQHINGATRLDVLNGVTMAGRLFARPSVWAP